MPTRKWALHRGGHALADHSIDSDTGVLQVSHWVHLSVLHLRKTPNANLDRADTLQCRLRLMAPAPASVLAINGGSSSIGGGLMMIIDVGNRLRRPREEEPRHGELVSVHRGIARTMTCPSSSHAMTVLSRSATIEGKRPRPSGIPVPPSRRSTTPSEALHAKSWRFWK